MEVSFVYNVCIPPEHNQYGHWVTSDGTIRRQLYLPARPPYLKTVEPSGQQYFIEKEDFKERRDGRAGEGSLFVIS